MTKSHKLTESGTILYLREHTKQMEGIIKENNDYMKEHSKEMKRLRYTIIIAALMAAAFLFWVIHTNRVGYAVEVARQVARSCRGV